MEPAWGAKNPQWINGCVFMSLHTFFFENVKKYINHDETCKMQLYFNFYKSSRDWQWNEKCKKKNKKDKEYTQNFFASI